MDGALREYVERYLVEDEVLLAARARAEALGCPPVGAGVGAALRFLAAALRARAVVEVGTGAGVGSLHLLSGMPANGVLTSIDVQPEHQRAARVAFAEAGVAVSRTRLIMGRALEVLPRLTDGVYDLVFVDAVKQEYPKYLVEAVRLLRPGGVVAFGDVLRHGRVVDPAHRDPDTQAVREVARAVRDDDRLVPVILPLGDGLLVAAKTD
ncbi:O-methyltransferase [Saccharothrix coeruleofusca]|uniref:O-methyltransferase n=1 Tax=Saccharothrix coeruleofusca TaxID=33919 RepID=A0A918AN24_9PSEU|nr:O-methyltransferase [Saccharothrix coeruleofusca]MBP2340917.1 putative O-methyltransferase YrrM [Saccharothrix coeruleofusca]GGP60791.1 O-methyltransferase [Saccharothrix coeruleofusca]